ncbi:MAG TPA: hypothetical protein PK530_08705 [Anaerolineales bacterium]|nr:hypothetical protein [Anaerolineales bacterium]
MNAKQFLNKRFKLVSIGIILFLILLCLTACLAIPIKVETSISPEPKVGEIVNLHIEVESKGQPAPYTVMTTTLSPGVELVEGNLIWEGELAADQPFTQDLKIRVIQEGEWFVSTYAFGSKSPDYRIGYGDVQTLLIQSSKDEATVINWEDREKTPIPAIYDPRKITATVVSSPEPSALSSNPLEITEATVSPDPLIGQVAILHIEFVSQDDEPETTLEIFLPEGIKLVKGDLTWKGSLTATQPQTHEISICTLYEGLWWIKMRARPWEAENDFKYTKEAGLILEVTQTNADVTTTENFYYTQPPDTPGPRILSTALPVDWVSPCP